MWWRKSCSAGAGRGSVGQGSAADDLCLQNMRMSCNSTYLLDQETDHGVKADELAALFEDLFAEPDAKAVVFSQWTRTHDILIRRLEARGLAMSASTAACRRKNGRRWSSGFVTTQLPRIPVHRCRQHRPQSAACFDPGEHGLAVEPGGPRAAHRAHSPHGPEAASADHQFRGEGHIEEGMLSVLAFKRSLSAGILDGASGEISLGGSRLNRFMKDVENVTGHMGEGEAVTPAEEVRNVIAAGDAGPWKM